MFSSANTSKHFNFEAFTKKKCFDDFDETLGHIIRRERSTQGESITDVSLEVRLSKAYIIAIEDGHISVFRIRRFVRSYVR